MKIKITELDLSCQTRAGNNPDVIDDYANLMREGTNFPSVKVFRTNDMDPHALLVDGYHRVLAAQKIGLQEVEADVIYGDRKAALTYALRANAQHGFQRTNADKHRALEIAWENRRELFGDTPPSKRQLSAICGVSDEFSRLFIKKLGVATVATPLEGASGEPVGNRSEKKLLKQHFDRFGTPIPEHLRAAFAPKAVDDMKSALRTAKRLLETARQSRDISFAGMRQTVDFKLATLLAEILKSRIYCICPNCRASGQPCDVCERKGIITETQFKQLPQELRPRKGGDGLPDFGTPADPENGPETRA